MRIKGFAWKLPQDKSSRNMNCFATVHFGSKGNKQESKLPNMQNDLREDGQSLLIRGRGRNPENEEWANTHPLWLMADPCIGLTESSSKAHSIVPVFPDFSKPECEEQPTKWWHTISNH